MKRNENNVNLNIFVKLKNKIKKQSEEMKLKSLKEIIEEKKNVCLIVYHFEIYFTKQFQLVCQRIMLLSNYIYPYF